ncbi:MAG: STAS domain-containing protein [Kiritimatiellia bacterium]
MQKSQETVSDRLEVAIVGKEAFVRVTGRGTFQLSPGLKTFGLAAIGTGCQRMTMYMENCSGMDSTFLGVVAGLAFRIRQRGGELVMLNLSSKNSGLLATLGLGGLISTGEWHPERSPSLPEMHTLHVSADKRILAETMLIAHEHLAAVAPQNIPKFKDLLMCLREDLKKIVPENKRNET